MAPGSHGLGHAAPPARALLAVVPRLPEPTSHHTQTIIGPGAARLHERAPRPSVHIQGDISGEVASADGKPLMHACVYLYPKGDTSRASYASCTASDGSYRISGVEVGQYDVAFSDAASGYATQWYNGRKGGSSTEAGAVPIIIDSSDETVTGLDAVMAPIGEISGAVTVAGTGDPVPRACAYLYRAGDDRSAAYASCTLRDGSYHIAGVVTGRYDLVFSGALPNYFVTQWYDGSSGGTTNQRQARDIWVTRAGQSLTGLDATVTPLGIVTGTVTEAGTNLPLYRACAYLYRSGSGGPAAYASCTLKDGRYVISGVVAGRYNVVFSDPSISYLGTQWFNRGAQGTTRRSSASNISVTEPHQMFTDVNAALVPLGTLSGVVNAAKTHKPVSGACVYLYPVGSGPASNASCTGPDGSYKVLGVPAGSYDVVFSDPGAGLATQWYDGRSGGVATRSGALALTILGGRNTQADATMVKAKSFWAS